MAETLAPVVEVNIGKSKETIKGLRESISKLRDQILNLTEGTDEYNEAVNQLQADQRKLDNVMALTKKTATALDGSYDALVHKMALLKKEWRATNDEARRNELGKQIDEINTRLKELDKSTGTFVRNVGNYESALDGLSDGVKDFGTQMRESMETVEPTKQQFESVSNIASGLASGFAAVKGAAALLGIENTNLEKSLVKVQAAMAIAQGIGGLKGLVEGFAKAKVAFKGLTTAVQVASKAMGATGWGLVIAAVITALTVLVSWIKKTSKEAEELKEKQDEVRQSHEEWSTSMSNSAAGLIAKYEKLREEWKSLGDDVKSRNNFIKQNQDAFEELGIKLQTIAEADKLFIDQTNDFITAVMKRATAQAYSDRLNQTAKQRVELEQTAKFNMAHTVVSNGGYTKGNNPFSYFQFTNGEIENAFSSEENLRKFYNDYLQFTKEVNGEQVPYGNKGINTWLGTAGNLVEYNVGETKENSLEMAQQLRANVIKILELYSQSKSDAKEIVKIEQELKALLGGVAGYTGGTTTTTTTTTTTASKTEDAEKKAIEGKI